VTLLSHYYSRKSDTLNRGYSGYNSNHMLAMIQQHIDAGIWPSEHAAAAEKESAAAAPPAKVAATIRPSTLLTLCLGANDSCLADGYSSAQSVPVDEYRANLMSILRLLKGADGARTPHLHVILIGPPQCDAHTWGQQR
jgi:hypothetical protein